MRTCNNNLRLVLLITSDGNINFLLNRKKVLQFYKFYEYHIAGFPKYSFLAEGKIVPNNQQHYFHMKKQFNACPFYIKQIVPNNQQHYFHMKKQFNACPFYIKQEEDFLATCLRIIFYPDEMKVF